MVPQRKWSNMNMRNYEKIEKSMWRNSKRCNGQLVSSSTLMCMITNIGDINLFTCSFTLSFVWCVLFRASSVFLEWLRNEPVSYLNMHKALIFCKPLLCAILFVTPPKTWVGISKNLLFSWTDESYNSHQIIDITSSMKTIKESVRIIPFNK